MVVVRRTHIRAALEGARVDCTDSQKARTKPDRGQGAGLDLLINLFAANEPVLREFCHGNVRLSMRLKIMDSHATPYLKSLADATYRDEVLCKRFAVLSGSDAQPNGSKGTTNYSQLQIFPGTRCT